MAMRERAEEAPDFNGISSEQFIAGHEILRPALSVDAGARLELLVDVAAAITYEGYNDRTSLEDVDRARISIQACLDALDRRRDTLAKVLAEPEVQDDPHSR